MSSKEKIEGRVRVQFRIANCEFTEGVGCKAQGDGLRNDGIMDLTTQDAGCRIQSFKSLKSLKSLEGYLLDSEFCILDSMNWPRV